ncbi:MAG: CARDB domain-containing protein [Candidatus Micrarchaeota archaeon]
MKAPALLLLAVMASFATALPDLVSSVYASNSMPYVGDTVTVFTTTSNIGSDWASSSVTSLFHRYGGALFNVPPLAPGANITNTSSFTCNETGFFNFSSFADFYFSVSESNENNNYNTYSIFCQPAQNQTLPDLTASIDFSNQNPRVGDTVTVHVKTQNIGDGAAGTSWTYAWDPTAYIPYMFFVPGLAPGQAADNNFTFTCPWAGNFGFNASADFRHNVDESNEGNNYAFANLYCAPIVTVTPPPGPVITNVRAENVTAVSAAIRWFTDVLSDSRVEYGLASGQYGFAAGNPNYVTYHVVPLNGLRPLTKYFFRVRSCNRGGCTYSPESSFKTKTMAVEIGKSDTGYALLAQMLNTNLNTELNELKGVDASEAAKYEPAARSLNELAAVNPPASIGRLQQLRAIIDDARKKASGTRTALLAVALLGIAVISTWYFWGKRRTRMRMHKKRRR